MGRYEPEGAAAEQPGWLMLAGQDYLGRSLSGGVYAYLTCGISSDAIVAIVAMSWMLLNNTESTYLVV